jgi:hypothetical protein
MVTIMSIVLLSDYFFASFFDGVGNDVVLLSSLVPAKPLKFLISQRLLEKFSGLTKSEREKISLTPDLMGILVGLLLGFDFLFKRK